jgi:hypothetical protein
MGETLRLGSLAAAAKIGFVMLLAQGLAAEAAEVKLIGTTSRPAVIRELGPQFRRETFMVS